MKLPILESRWFVVRTQPNAERLATDELRIGGFNAYLPIRRVRNFVRRQRVIRDHEEPLMPGYLFLAEPRTGRIDWGRLRNDIKFRHVGRPLRGAQGPLEIPSRIVVKISEDEIAGKYDETGATKRGKHQKTIEQFPVGGEFRVIDGPFAGFFCEVENVTPQDKIRALVGIFGRLAPVEFDPGQLEAA